MQAREEAGAEEGVMNLGRSLQMLVVRNRTVTLGTSQQKFKERKGWPRFAEPNHERRVLPR